MNSTPYTDKLRKELQAYMDRQKLNPYRVGKASKVHRFVVTEFLKGKGLHYDSGMALRVYLRDSLFAEKPEFTKE